MLWRWRAVLLLGHAAFAACGDASFPAAGHVPHAPGPPRACFNGSPHGGTLVGAAGSLGLHPRRVQGVDIRVQRVAASPNPCLGLLPNGTRVEPSAVGTTNYTFPGDCALSPSCCIAGDAASGTVLSFVSDAWQPTWPVIVNFTHAPAGVTCEPLDGTSYFTSSTRIQCRVTGVLRPGSVSITLRVGNTTLVSGTPATFDMQFLAVCPDGMYPTNTSEGCTACPSGGICPGGLWPPASQAGYAPVVPREWELRGLPVADVFDAAVARAAPAFAVCPIQEACLANDTCAVGARGWLCSACEPGWAPVAQSTCKPCSTSVVNYVIITVVVLGVLIFCIFLIQRAMRRRSKMVIVARMLINFLQMTAALRVYLTYSSTSATTRSFISLASAANFVNLDLQSVICAMSLRYYPRFIGYMLLPVLAVLLPYLLLLLYHACSERCPRLGLKPMTLRKVGKSTMTSAGVLLFFIHNAVTAAILNVWNCAPLRKGGYLLSHPDVSCHTPDHLLLQRVVAPILLVVYGAGIPALAVFLLWRNRRWLASRRMLKYFSFAYDGFRRHVYWWECWTLLRKVSFLAAGVLVVDPQLQLATGLSLMIIVLSMHIYLQPYEERFLNALESLALAGSLVMYLGMLVYTLPGVATDTALQAAIGWFVFAVNMFVLAAFVFALALALRQQALIAARAAAALTKSSVNKGTTYTGKVKAAGTNDSGTVGGIYVSRAQAAMNHARLVAHMARMQAEQQRYMTYAATRTQREREMLMATRMRTQRRYDMGTLGSFMNMMNLPSGEHDTSEYDDHLDVASVRTGASRHPGVGGLDAISEAGSHSRVGRRLSLVSSTGARPRLPIESMRSIVSAASEARAGTPSSVGGMGTGMAGRRMSLARGGAAHGFAGGLSPTYHRSASQHHLLLRAGPGGRGAPNESSYAFAPEAAGGGGAGAPPFHADVEDAESVAQGIAGGYGEDEQLMDLSDDDLSVEVDDTLNQHSRLVDVLPLWMGGAKDTVAGLTPAWTAEARAARRHRLSAIGRAEAAAHHDRPPPERHADRPAVRHVAIQCDTSTNVDPDGVLAEAAAAGDIQAALPGPDYGEEFGDSDDDSTSLFTLARKPAPAVTMNHAPRVGANVDRSAPTTLRALSGRSYRTQSGVSLPESVGEGSMQGSLRDVVVTDGVALADGASATPMVTALARQAHSTRRLYAVDAAAAFAGPSAGSDVTAASLEAGARYPTLSQRLLHRVRSQAFDPSVLHTALHTEAAMLTTSGGRHTPVGTPPLTGEARPRVGTPPQLIGESYARGGTPPGEYRSLVTNPLASVVDVTAAREVDAAHSPHALSPATMVRRSNTIAHASSRPTSTRLGGRGPPDGQGPQGGSRFAETHPTQAEAMPRSFMSALMRSAGIAMPTAAASRSRAHGLHVEVAAGGLAGPASPVQKLPPAARTGIRSMTVMGARLSRGHEEAGSLDAAGSLASGRVLMRSATMEPTSPTAADSAVPRTPRAHAASSATPRTGASTRVSNMPASSDVAASSNAAASHPMPETAVSASAQAPVLRDSEGVPAPVLPLLSPGSARGVLQRAASTRPHDPMQAAQRSSVEHTS